MASKHFVKVVLLKELKCFRCREIKTINNFFRDSSSKTGIKAFCKSCENKKSSDFDKPGYIRCLNCDEYKEISCFNIDSRKKSGRKGTCSDCISINNGRKRYRYGKKECPSCNIEKFHKDFGSKHKIKGQKVEYFDVCKLCRDKEKKVDDGYKRCGKCKEIRLITEFYKNSHTKSGLSSTCVLCEAANRLLKPKNKIQARNIHLKKYEITLEEYDALLEKQGGECATPGCHITPEIEGQALAVDHDHDCHEDDRKGCKACIRGILCFECNWIAGKVDKSLDRVLEVIKYVESGYRPFANID